MNSRKWLILGILVVLLLAASVYMVSASSKTVAITVDTNGSDVTVKGTLTPIPIVPVPEAMIDEMKNKAMEGVQDDTSTVESIKADMVAIAQKYNYTAQVKLTSPFGENQLPMPATVKGTSMVPTLQDGQDIIVLKTTDFKVGDLVVARHPDYGLIVKRIAQIKGDQVYLKSDNRQIEIVGTETRIVNGVEEVITIEKTPLDTWLSRPDIVGVVY
ncbi:MAG: S24/S26 family peptidase [Methanobacteriaceae archaeon]|nr:S24/S26 family peptidase [Methanobacteriaceae archaeon]